MAGLAAVAVLAAASAALAAPAARQPQTQRLDGRVHRALLDLYALDTRLASAQSRVATLEAAGVRLRHERAAIERERRIARATLEVSQRQLAGDLRTLYEQGNVDSLAVVFGATSLDTGVRNLDALTRVADESRHVVVTTRAAARRLAHARSSLRRESRLLTRAIASARSAAQSLAGAAASTQAYVSSLRTRLDRVQVRSVVSTAHKVTRRTRQLQPKPPPPPSHPGGGGRKMVVSATCYDLSGHTATGMPVGWGVIAVDPNVIPLGTRLYVPGYGKGVAADVGGGIKGAIIDLWMPWSSCSKWGRRTVTITVY